MNKKFLTLSATAVAAALALAGCSTGTPGSSATSGSPAATGSSTPGMDHGGPGMMSSSAPATAADVTFAQMMIPHHAQAVEMSDMMLKKQNVPAEVTSLATKIKAAQGPEIETMTGWLKSWNEPTQMPSGHAGHSMNGMMSETDMKALDAAKGTEAARLFLKQMIAHHEGAIMMAKTENTAGKNADAVQLSKDIVTAQEVEIQEMQKLLATL
jgi:uncharacterized protein (DUF305 family)